MSNTVMQQIQRGSAYVAFLSKHADYLTENEHAYREGNWSGISFYQTWNGINFSISGNHEQSKNLMTDFRRYLGGKWDKDARYGEFILSGEVDGIHVEISCDREAVCTKRVVGTKTVVHEATEARVEEVEEVEWDCGLVLDD